MKTILAILLSIVLVLAALALAPAAFDAINQLTAVSGPLVNQAGNPPALTIQVVQPTAVPVDSDVRARTLPTPASNPAPSQPDANLTGPETAVSGPTKPAESNTASNPETAVFEHVTACDVAAATGRRGSPRCADNRPTATPAGVGR